MPRQPEFRYLDWVCLEALDRLTVLAPYSDIGKVIVTDGEREVWCSLPIEEAATRRGTLQFSWPYGAETKMRRATKLIANILAYKVPDVWEWQVEQMLRERMDTYRYVQFNAAASDFARSHPI